jgi:hypothetical protein
MDGWGQDLREKTRVCDREMRSAWSETIVLEEDWQLDGVTI